MSEQRPESDEYDVASSGAPAEVHSSNGTYADAAIGIAEPEPAEAGPAEAGPAEPEAPAAPAADDGTAFLADLARAMQATADAERTRVAEDADRRRDAHLAAIQERRESEAARMRELAAEDLKAIDAWADSERDRIAQERERRAAALQADLEASLSEHGAKIDQEIEGVEAAIAQYRTEVDGFFATIGQETDPVEIARHASRRPLFPDLDAIGVTEVAPEEPAVAVMDPDLRDPDPAVAWSQWNEPAPTADIAEPPAEETPSEEVEAVAVTAPAAEQAATGTVLQAVPVHRPFGFLRGDRHEDE
jgi:hypothetical protein